MPDRNFAKRRKIEDGAEENSSGRDSNDDSNPGLSVTGTEDEPVTLQEIVSLLCLLVLSIPVYNDMIRIVQFCTGSAFFSVHAQNLPCWNPIMNVFDYGSSSEHNTKIHYVDLWMKVPLDRLRELLLPENKVLHHLEVQLFLKSKKFCSHRHVFNGNESGMNFRVPVRCDPQNFKEFLCDLQWKFQFFDSGGTADFTMRIAGQSFGQFRDNQLFGMTLGQISHATCYQHCVNIDVLVWARGCGAGISAGTDSEDLPTWLPQESCLWQMYQAMREYPVIIVEPDEPVLALRVD